MTKTTYMGGNLFNGSARAFNHRTEALCAACERLGGTPPAADPVVLGRKAEVDIIPVMGQAELFNNGLLVILGKLSLLMCCAAPSRGPVSAGSSSG